jgi:hypothetical protein
MMSDAIKWFLCCDDVMLFLEMIQTPDVLWVIYLINWNSDTSILTPPSFNIMCHKGISLFK